MIKVKNISKSFFIENKEYQVLKNISLSIEQGDFIAIVGPSGSGKTTLLKILGLLDNAFDGEYMFEEKNVRNFSDYEISEMRNKKVGFVFQDFNLIDRLTVYENVQLPSLYNDSLQTTRVMDLLAQMGIEEKSKMFPNQLSGGQQQRVSIARALVNNPSVIVADEPTGALDNNTSKEIIEILKDLNNNGATILLITHDESIARQTNKVIQISDGMIV